MQLVAILSIPTSLIYTYGVFADNLKQARLIYLITLGIFIGFTIITAIGEYNGNQAVNSLLGVERAVNFEGKEVRFGWAQWPVCGNYHGYHVRSGDRHARFFDAKRRLRHPLESVPANRFRRSGNWHRLPVLAYLILAVFVTGLMVDEPRNSGRKIEKREVVLASFLILPGSPDRHPHPWKRSPLAFPRLSGHQ
ncbi:MAG UNVERIFIED_CONTAM: potassium-transporting ATPase subunit KdpA [Microcystis novacekii LVE1205-3]